MKVFACGLLRAQSHRVLFKILVKSDAPSARECLDVFIYVNFADGLQLFWRFYVYRNNNIIRSTPTWASPLYRRPHSFSGGEF